MGRSPTRGKITYELRNQKEWETDKNKSEYQSDDDSEESDKEDSEESYNDDDNKVIESVLLHLVPGLMVDFEFLSFCMSKRSPPASTLQRTTSHSLYETSSLQLAPLA